MSVSTEHGGSSTSEQESPPDKVVLLLKATGNAPVMKKMKWSVSRKQKIHWVVDFIRKYISCAPSESLFLHGDRNIPMQNRQIRLDACNLISDFIESVIHLYLYERNVYPRSSFTDFVVFGLHLKICNNPDVKEYIFNCVESIRPQLSEINELRVIIKVYSTRYFFLLLQEYFATVLIRLKMLDSTLPSLEFETTWELWVQFSSSCNQNENPTMLWSLISNNSSKDVKSGTIYPIKSFHTEDIQMQVLLLQH
ncbi:unnamed protein product [Heterobilharzia americana]|nr:unnamed protein product [Heterobilharzia americana]